MSLKTMLFGTGPQTKTRIDEKDLEYKEADKRLKELAEKRSQMRQQLADAMKQIIEERAQ